MPLRTKLGLWTAVAENVAAPSTEASLFCIGAAAVAIARARMEIIGYMMCTCEREGMGSKGEIDRRARGRKVLILIYCYLTGSRNGLTRRDHHLRYFLHVPRLILDPSLI